MSARDRLSLLAVELDALPERRRRAILAALTPIERARMASLLSSEAGQDAGAIEHGFSPAIASRIGEARDLGAPAGHGGRMTPAGRRLLLDAAQALAARHRATPAAVSQSRSLISVLGGLIPGGGGR